MSENNSLIVQPSELDKIYHSGKVSPDVRGTFSTSLEKGLSIEGITLDKYMETNKRLKIEMKEYLDRYKLQRSMMESVIYYLKNPSYAPVKFADRITGFFGKKTQLEAKRIANDPQAIRKLFEEMALSIEQSRGKTLELEQQAISLYNASLFQRENIDKDITELLQKISVNKDKIIRLEDDVNKVNGGMDKLLVYMEQIGIVVKGGRPMLEESDKNGKIGDNVPEIAVNNYEDRLNKLINQDDIQNVIETEKIKDIKSEDIKHDDAKDKRILEKKKIEAIKVYHTINNEILKVENALRDVRNEKLVLHQNYERAKENLVLYEKVLITQVDEARNYFAMLFAIYDAEVKYTLPSARLVASLASLQEVASQLAQQLYDARNIFNSLIDNVTSGALEIQEGIQLLAINPSWNPETIEKSESKTIELARRTKEFTYEMDRRLTEVQAAYKNPSLQVKIKERALLDSGIEDQFLKNLLNENASNSDNKSESDKLLNNKKEQQGKSAL